MYPVAPRSERSGGIREALKLWQEQHDSVQTHISGQHASSALEDSQNLLNQSGEDDSFTTISRDDEVDNDDDISIEREDQNPDIFIDETFLRRGDLVQLM